MCEPKQHFSFCTCDIEANLISLDQYWLVYRQHNRMEFFSIGQCVIPIFGLDKEQKDIEKQLLNDLNQKKSFDKDLKFKSQDLMIIKFKNVNPGEDMMEFQFRFQGGRWGVLEDFETELDLGNMYDLLHKGKLKSIKDLHS